MEKTHSWCILQIRFVFCSLFAVRGGDSSWNLSKLVCVSYEIRCKNTIILPIGDEKRQKLLIFCGFLGQSERGLGTSDVLTSEWKSEDIGQELIYSEMIFPRVCVHIYDSLTEK